MHTGPHNYYRSNVLLCLRFINVFLREFFNHLSVIANELGSRNGDFHARCRCGHLEAGWRGWPASGAWGIVTPAGECKRSPARWSTRVARSVVGVSRSHDPARGRFWNTRELHLYITGQKKWGEILRKLVNVSIICYREKFLLGEWTRWNFVAVVNLWLGISRVQHKIIRK